MNRVTKHLKESKITTSAAAILALLSVFGPEGDPETVEALRGLLEANIDTITHVGAILLLLFAKDPRKDPKDQGEKE